MAIDYKAYLPSNYSDNPLWSDLFDEIQELAEDFFHDPSTELANIRNSRNLDTKSLQDIVYLYRNSNQLGYEFLRDFFTEEDYDVLYSFASLFFNRRSTRSLQGFISYLLGTRFELNQLWTNSAATDDYTRFFTRAQLSDTDLITNGGTYYNTSQVELSFDATLNSQQDDDRIRELFYNLAPIWLVLNRVTPSSIRDETLVFSAPLVYPQEFSQQAVYNQTNFNTTIHYSSSGVDTYLIQGVSLDTIPTNTGDFSFSFGSDFS